MREASADRGVRFRFTRAVAAGSPGSAEFVAVAAFVVAWNPTVIGRRCERRLLFHGAMLFAARASVDRWPLLLSGRHVLLAIRLVSESLARERRVGSADARGHERKHIPPGAPKDGNRASGEVKILLCKGKSFYSGAHSRAEGRRMWLLLLLLRLRPELAGLTKGTRLLV